MTPKPVTANLLHDLVARSHAEGTTLLAVAALVEDGDHILLIEARDTAGALDRTWEPPSDLVLPGETLTDAVHRTAAAAGVRIDRITSYLGHHDAPTDGDVRRTFVFAATPEHHGRGLATTARHAHQWAATDDLPGRLDDNLARFVFAVPATDNAPDHDPQRCPWLSRALRADARGLLALEAAVELLIGHRFWLHHHDFVDAYVATHDPDGNPAPTAWVDWPAAITALDTQTLPCSTGEARMLRLAASLAEGIPVDLRDTLTGLDIDNLDLVTRAVLHTAGQ